jgi:pimeloyl-ACP methyl ester carboxylesterase
MKTTKLKEAHILFRQEFFIHKQHSVLRQARAFGAAQKPINGGNFTEKTGPAAWKNLPSWYLISQQDKSINPDLERWMAKRINATTREIRSSHASLISSPREVAQTIFAASKAGAKK